MTRLDANKGILKLLSAIVDGHPDWRFHQILQNYCIVENGVDKWHEESEQTLDMLKHDMLDLRSECIDDDGKLSVDCMDEPTSKWGRVKGDVYASITNALRSAIAYEANDAETWANAIQVAGSIVQPYEDDGTIADFQIVCDEETNTEEVVGMNAFALKFLWKENEDDDWTTAEFMLTPIGMNWKETPKED